MKILQLANYVNPFSDTVIFDGVNKFVLDSTLALTKAGHEVTILATSDSNANSVNLLKVDSPSRIAHVSIGNPSPEKAGWVAQSKALTNEYAGFIEKYSSRYDLIINNVVSIDRVHAVLDKLEIPSITMLHAPAVFLGNYAKVYAARLQMMKHTKIVSVSQYMHDLVARLGVNSDIIPSAILLGETAETAVSPTQCLSHVSRLERNKNVLVSGACMLRYCQNHDYALKIVGDFSVYGSRIPSYVAFKQECEDQLLHQKRVEHCSSMPHREVLEVMRHSAASVFSGAFESLGLSIVEYLSVGTPVILPVSNVPCFRYVDSVVGDFYPQDLYFDYKDKTIEQVVDGISQRLVDVVADYQDTSKRQWLADQVYQRYNYHEFVNKITELHQAL